MNNYEAKQAIKKVHYAEKAKKYEAEAKALYEYDWRQMSLIPLGQPILVGHHSERNHRTFLKRSQQRLAKIQKLQQKADYYRKRAENRDSVISSNDENAVIKLQKKLDSLQMQQEKMKRVNAEYRKGGFGAITSLSEEEIAFLKTEMQCFSWQRKPFPSFCLSNNNAEMRRVRQRIVELEAKEQAEPQKMIEGNGFRIIENHSDNRIWFEFYEKPVPVICQVMKQHGFKWSPSRKAWVRMLNQSGRFQAQCAIAAIGKL